jgi:hypothetical protein
MYENPFKVNTTSYKDFEVLKDLKWHCTKCELKSAQAKTWQVWRQMGLQLRTDEKGNYYKKKFCNNCSANTIHRSLLTVDIQDDTKLRSNIPPSLAIEIKKTFNYQEAVLLRELLSKELEIDHKFPQIRWSKNEEINVKNMTVNEIKRKFILLNRSNNLLKSRNCEKCVKTGERGNFPGIYYWYNGTSAWDSNTTSYDEKGCIGCFWYDPYTWRESLNQLIKQSSK